MRSESVIRKEIITLEKELKLVEAKKEEDNLLRSGKQIREWAEENILGRFFAFSDEVLFVSQIVSTSNMGLKIKGDYLSTCADSWGEADFYCEKTWEGFTVAHLKEIFRCEISEEQYAKVKECAYAFKHSKKETWQEALSAIAK